MTTTYYDTFETIMESPLPASVFAGSLFASAALQKNTIPRLPSALGFGGTAALGAYIINDGDVINGAGFVSAWSTLYLMVNGRASIKTFRPLPVALTIMAMTNAVGYGKTFFFPKTRVLPPSL